MSDELPFSLENLAGAAIRALILPTDTPSTTVPAIPSDIFAQVSPYAPAGSWIEVGATSGPAQVGRNITLGGLTIEQSQTVVLKEPTEVAYTVQIPFAELRPEIIQLGYEGAIETVAAGTGHSAGTKVGFGAVEELSHYRVAFVVKRKKVQGVVQEGASGRKRGRYLVYVAHDCTISQENVQTSFAKGALSSMAVTFELNPITGQPQGEEHGFWFDEHAGTIALT